MTKASLVFSSRRKTPLILQTEAAECGLACLAMIAGHYGHRTDLATLRSRFSISLKGTTLTTLSRIAAQLDFHPRVFRLEMEALHRLQLPAILHWDLNHFVVLIRVKRQTAIILDPVRGRRTLSFAEVSKHFTGVAMELSPAEKFKPRTERCHISIRQLVGRMSGLGRGLAQLLLLAAAIEVFGILGPLLMQLVVDHVIVAGDRDLLAVLASGFLLLMLIQVGATALRSWVTLRLSTTLNLHLLTRLFSHLLNLPMSYFARRHLGDIVSRFESLTSIRRAITSTMLQIIVDGMVALTTGFMMFLYSPKLALVVCAATFLYGALRVARYHPLREASREQIVLAAKQETNFLETIRGMQSVKLFNRQSQRSIGYHNLAVDTLNADIRVQKLRVLFTSLNGILFGLENIGVTWLGALLVLDGGFSVGMLFAFIAYKQQFESRIANVIDNAIETRMLDLHAERVADIALTEAEPEVTDSLSEESMSGDIEVRDLGVRYSDSDPFVLRHFNLSIRDGESVAIVGPSGCGKTTLVKALLGLLPAAEGEIFIGGRSLNRIGTAQYRNLIGTVMQDDKLFAGSIADNICFFEPQVDMDRVQACAHIAAIHDDILAMPMGYHTLIGDMGTVLSGGQQQRVLLARALYKEPRILFLDEATSHLDLARERQVSDAIRLLRLTRVIVAHRPETISSADRVVVVQNAQTTELSQTA